MTDFNTKLSLIECCANVFALLEDEVVESCCKCESCIVQHLILFLDTDDVFGSCLLKYGPDFLRVTRCHENKVQLALVLSDHLLQLLSANELTATFLVLKHQEIALAFILLVEFFAHLLVVFDSMTAKVQTDWFLGEDLLQAVCCALAFSNVNLYMCRRYAVPYLLELSRKVQLHEEFVLVLLLLKHQR